MKLSHAWLSRFVPHGKTPEQVRDLLTAHVATVDGVANLAQWLACLAALLSWRRGGDGWLALSVLLAGVATGAKTDHALVVIPVALAYAWRERRTWRHLPLLLLLP